MLNHLAFTNPPLHGEYSLTATLALLLELTPNEARMLTRLVEYDHASRRELHIAIADGEPATRLKIVDAILCRLRRKLKPHGITITNVWALGYRLADGARDKLRGLVAGLGAEVVAATRPAGKNDHKKSEATRRHARHLRLLNRQPPIIGMLCIAFGLRPGEGRALEKLVQQGYASREELHAVISRADNPMTGIETVGVTVYSLRRKLKPYDIEVVTRHGLGCRLGEVDRNKIREMLAGYGAEIVDATTPAGKTPQPEGAKQMTF